MDKSISSIVIWSLLGFVVCQYDHEHGRGGFQPNAQYNQPPASILLHKQALGQDGSFNYAFAADNGLQQGEVINPDGSRRGSYSYVDPNGKTVSLSYTAGKDGFRVLNGDHVPKAPEQQQQRPNPQYYQQQQPQRQHSHYSPQPHLEPHHYPQPYRGNAIPYEAYRNSPNAPVYRGNGIPYEEAFVNGHHHPPPPPPHSMAQYQAAHRHPPQSPHARPMPHYQPRQYSVQEGNYEKPSPYLAQQYQRNHRPEEPQKPHSFGNGFAFEFAG